MKCALYYIVYTICQLFQFTAMARIANVWNFVSLTQSKEKPNRQNNKHTLYNTVLIFSSFPIILEIIIYGVYIHEYLKKMIKQICQEKEYVILFRVHFWSHHFCTYCKL